MGQRPKQEPHSHAPQDKPDIQVDAARIINRLRNQRAQLESQLDIVEVAFEEAQVREQQLLARIAELEDKDKD